MEREGKVESAFWNLFFNHRVSSSSAHINLRLRTLSSLLVIASSFTSLAEISILFQVWPCWCPPLKRMTNWIAWEGNPFCLLNLGRPRCWLEVRSVCVRAPIYIHLQFLCLGLVSPRGQVGRTGECLSLKPIAGHILYSLKRKPSLGIHCVSFTIFWDKSGFKLVFLDP